MTLLNEVTWSDDLPADCNRVRQQLHKDGYSLVRNLIPLDDMQKLRMIVGEHLGRSGARFSLGKTQPNAAAHIAELSFIFAHPRVVSLFSGVFGAGSAVFTRHCDIHKNMVSGWHKDSGESVEGGYFKGDYFNAEECEVYKIALYLQDSTPTSGLSIVPGSHHDATVAPTEVLQLPSRLGDAVVFDVRLTHTGQLPDTFESGLKVLAKTLKRSNRQGEDPRIVTVLHDLYWRLLRREDRQSVFFTFGQSNAFTFDFAAANLARQARQLGESVGNNMGNLSALADDLHRQGILTYGVNIGGNEVAADAER